jgi:HK97 family phage portal protein
MSRWFDRLRRKAAPPASSARPAFSDVLPYPQMPAPTDDLRMYRESAWVYVAVTRIAEAGALVPLRVYELDGEQKRPIDNHPLEHLLAHPNPFMSRFDLLEQTLAMLELTGSAFWFLSGDANGLPSEIWPMRPDRVGVVADAKAYIGGYVYEVGGQRVTLDPAEVVHFRRWNPTDDFAGMGTVTAARSAIETDRAMARWNRAAFGQDYGVPAGIVNIREYVSDADFERIQHEWRNSYGDGQRRTAFVRGGTLEWHGIGLHHAELEFLRGRQAQRDEILAAFGIPLGLIDANATEANATVAERQFVNRTLWPKLVRLADKLTTDLLPFYPGTLLAEFDDVRLGE